MVLTMRYVKGGWSLVRCEENGGVPCAKDDFFISVNDMRPAIMDKFYAGGGKFRVAPRSSFSEDDTRTNRFGEDLS
jgi:hypothetical protein